MARSIPALVEIISKDEELYKDLIFKIRQSKVRTNFGVHVILHSGIVEDMRSRVEAKYPEAQPKATPFSVASVAESKIRSFLGDAMQVMGIKSSSETPQTGSRRSSTTTMGRTSLHVNTAVPPVRPLVQMNSRTERPRPRQSMPSHEPRRSSVFSVVNAVTRAASDAMVRPWESFSAPPEPLTEPGFGPLIDRRAVLRRVESRACLIKNGGVRLGRPVLGRRRSVRVRPTRARRSSDNSIELEECSSEDEGSDDGVAADFSAWS